LLGIVAAMIAAIVWKQAKASTETDTAAETNPQAAKADIVVESSKADFSAPVADAV